jgi:hypothetical protein
MRTAFVEMVCARLALPASLIFAHLAILILIVVSIVQVFKTLGDLIITIAKVNNFILAGALITTFVPATFILFSSGRAIMAYLDYPSRRVALYFQRNFR